MFWGFKVKNCKGNGGVEPPRSTPARIGEEHFWSLSVVVIPDIVPLLQMRRDCRLTGNVPVEGIEPVLFDAKVQMRSKNVFMDSFLAPQYNYNVD